MDRIDWIKAGARKMLSILRISEKSHHLAL
jgi:hypothetical protein